MKRETERDKKRGSKCNSNEGSRNNTLERDKKESPNVTEA